jgi:MoaA/NifB/PqqE/SkfB family radical SAM enzyme
MSHPLPPDDYPPAELAKARRRHLARQSALLRQPLAGPLEVGVVLTYRCNHGCRFCALPLEPTARGEMPAALAERLIGELAALDVEQISFTGGGEPMLSEALPALVEQTRAAGLACSVCTNGSRLTETLAEHWARLGVHISVSFNAATPDVYRHVHRGAGPDDFARILDRLRAFAAAAAREGGEGSLVSLNFVIHRENWMQIEAMADLARSVGAAQIQYRLIQPRTDHRELELSAEQLAKVRAAVRRVETAFARDAAFTVQVAAALRADGGGAFGEWGLRPGVTPEAFHDDRTRAPCLEGYVASYIDADGAVFPCCLRSADIANHVMGNVGEAAFGDIWRGESYARFRREAGALDPASLRIEVNGCAHCPKAKHFLYLIDEFSPGNYLDLARRSAAAREEELAALKRRAARAAVLSPAAMRAEFGSVEAPAAVAAGAKFEVRAAVKNTGGATWFAWDLAGGRAIGLGWHWRDSRGRVLQFDNNPRAYLDRDIAPGETAELTIWPTAPPGSGRRTLELAMVQEQTAWFEQHGGATRRLPIAVG